MITCWIIVMLHLVSLVVTDLFSKIVTASVQPVLETFRTMLKSRVRCLWNDIALFNSDIRRWNSAVMTLKEMWNITSENSRGLLKCRDMSQQATFSARWAELHLQVLVDGEAITVWKYYTEYAFGWHRPSLGFALHINVHSLLYASVFLLKCPLYS